MDGCLKYKCQNGSYFSATQLQEMGRSLSGPGALEISNPFSKLRTPLESTEMVAIARKGKSEIVGGVSDECGVKTEVK